MKKNFILIIPLILCLLFISDVDAVVNGGGASTGGGGTTGTGSWCVNGLPTCSGIRITITKSERTSESYKCRFELDRTALNNAGFTNHESWWKDGYYLDSTYLYKFLNIPYGTQSGTYQKLIDLIEDNRCSISNDDYIYIEPFATQSGSRKTLHQAIISGNDLSKDGSIYRSLANAAATGKKVGSYDSVSESCGVFGSSHCGVKQYGGNGYGVLELKASDLMQSNTMKVTKLVNGHTQSGVTFKLVNVSNNETVVLVTDINGQVSFTMSSSTTYNLYEVITNGYSANEARLEYEETFGGGSGNRRAPTGYDKDGNPYWHITSTYVDRDIKIINKTTCQGMFEQYKNTMQGRIELYEMMLQEGKNFTNILNLDITDASQACSAATCTIDICEGCLSSTVGYNTEFNSRNLSCYNEVRDGLYCFNSFELSNSLSSNSFSINQGGVLLKDVSITGVLTTSCYGGYANSTFNYSDYIKELNIENASNSKKLSTGKITSSETSKDNLYTTKLTTNYKLPSVYASILSGKASYNKCDNCRFLGYGIITKFIEENGTFNGTFSSKLKIDKGKFNVNNGTLSGDCTYYSNPELIDSGGLNLEFRIIDTENPFPGKSGNNNRKVGLNWCDGDNCTQDNNSLITTYIKDANNSYNKNKVASPKYKITLSSADIEVIKKYNKKAENYGGYDDNTLSCKSENNCSSTFIEGLKSGILKYSINGNKNSEEYIGNMLNKITINK